MKKLIIVTILLIVVSILHIFRDNIYYLYLEHQFHNNYIEPYTNNYKLDFTFLYAQEHESTKLYTKNDILGSVYYMLNSGSKFLSRYCSYYYKNCLNDIKAIAYDNKLLSDFNNFVHPFNSFKKISFEVDGATTLNLEYTPIYNIDDIYVLNIKVDSILKEVITNDMSDRDKLLAIHDYIIDNTKYDILKKEDINDPTYKSNTAYGPLIEGYGICSGYVDAYSLFLYKLDIPNYKISNDTHVWNLVYIEGEWLHIDLTWDDPVTDSDIDILKHDYFLIDTETILSSDEHHYFDKDKFKEAS